MGKTDPVTVSPRAVCAELLEQVWAIRPTAMHTIWAAAAAMDAGVLPPTERAGPLPAARAPLRGTALIPVYGPISRRLSFLSLFFGGTSIEQVAGALRAALADPAVSRIVLDFDSPGGTSEGVSELASEIYAARSKKPITALVDTVAASAAYWLAAQASEVVMTPSAQVGSIGVFALHLDHSAELDKLGIKPTFIQAGKFKTEENPLQPLSDDAKAAIQERVDGFFGLFVRDVARGRGVSVETVRSEFGEGRMVLAKEAVKRGMADSVGARGASEDARAADQDVLVFAAARAAVALAETQITAG